MDKNTVALYSRAYARAGTQRALDEISRQDRELREYAARHGFGEVKSFSDTGSRAVAIKRPGILAILDAVQNEEIDTVITKSLVSLAKKPEVAENVVRAILSTGVRFISIQDNIDQQLAK